MFMGETSGTVSSGDTAPFWLSANKWGLASTEGNSGYLRAAISRDICTDSLRSWQVGYGADIVAAANHTSSFFVHQLYAEVEHGAGRLTVGAKELDNEFVNPRLSTGGMTSGMNARPVPQIRLATSHYIPLPLTDGWVSASAMMAYGWFTDGGWQRSFVADGALRTSGVRYHAKSLYLKVGDESRFPLTLKGGIEFASQFGGEAWNLNRRDDDMSGVDLSHVEMDNSLGGYINTFFFRGKDPNDGDYHNMEGNHLGSWHGSVEYQGRDWKVRGYAEHFFEDHSQLFWQYGWKDMTLGIEAELPKNPFVSTVVVEHLSTRDQTSGMYHDATANLPVQISGADNYYNHHVYGCWQHWGMTMGNPLLISPIYNERNELTITHNRIRAIHLGIAGQPTASIDYRLMYTGMRSWGNYWSPPVNTVSSHFLFAECTYRPTFLSGYSLTAAFGMNRGQVMERSTGMTLTLRKEIGL